MKSVKLSKMFHIECEKDKKHLIIYSIISAVFAIVALVLGVNWILSIIGGALLFAFLCIRLKADDSLPVSLRFVILAVITLIIFMLMQTTISCGFVLITPIKFIMNIVLLLGLSSLFWMVSGNLKFSATVVTLLCTVIAVADHLVVQARSFEIQFSDLSSIGVAAEVAGGYSFEVSQTTRTGIILSICFLTFVIRSSLPSHERSWHRTAICLGSIVLTVLCAVMIYTQFCASVVGYQDKYWKYRGSERNGFWVNIIYSASATRVTKPDDYDSNELQGKLDEYLEDSESEVEKKDKKPNVIVIMNETFSDIDNISQYMNGKMVCSVEPTPYLDSISNDDERVIKGHALASVYGGNTANSELEFLSQMSIQYIPRNSVAYNLYIKEENTFSIVDLFNQAGYYTIGMHPENRTNWQREKIYSYYGFDETYFIDEFTDLTEEDYYREHVSDAAVYRKIEEIYENRNTDEPFFAFAVTMQNHGGYLGTGFEPEDYTVDIEGYENYMSVREYLACINNSDMALKELIEYFDNVDEDTIIVFYGDHQPSISSISSKFYGIDDDSSTAIQQAKYVVPYLIRANYPIECDRATPLTSFNFLSSWILDMVGIEGTEFNRFVRKTNENIMAINAMGWFDYEYNFHETDYVNQDYDETLKLYAKLQYNALFEKENKLTKIFGIKGKVK